MTLGLVAGMGSAFAAATNPRTAGLFGGSAGQAVSASDVAGAGGADESAIDRTSRQSRSSANRPFDEPDVIVAPPTAADVVEPAPSVMALPAGLTAADVESGLLSPDVPEVAGGTFVVVPGSDPGPGTGPVRTVRVEVEHGLAVDGAAFAATVMATLNDPRSWGGDGSMSFARTDGDAELRVVLASPQTVDELCAPLETGGEVSCGRGGRAVLNLRRWVHATSEYANDKTAYRQYLVNHEVGHLLGHGHEKCAGAGQVAAVMQQQSYKAAPCQPNPWPFP